MAILQDCYQAVAGSGKILSVGVSEATDTVKKSAVYILTSTADCYIRFDDSNAVVGSDGNFDLMLPAGGSAAIRATATTIRTIQDGTSTGTLAVTEVAVV